MEHTARAEADWGGEGRRKVSGTGAAVSSVFARACESAQQVDKPTRSIVEGGSTTRSSCVASLLLLGEIRVASEDVFGGGGPSGEGSPLPVRRPAALVLGSSSEQS